jgi:Fe-S-cluster-containing hydrogenase component 2
LNAIVLNDNLARIDTSKCNGCGSCAQACPQQIIRITQKETL